jgi:hypothetical protein
MADIQTALASAKPMDEKSRLEKQREQLRNEYVTWEDTFRQLGRFYRPRMPKFLRDQPDRGDRRDSNIVNNWGGFAVRTLSSGMMAGITSPSRAWFKLSTGDPDLDSADAVKLWLSETERRMRDVMLKSNLYQQLPKLYTSLGVFGTGALFEEEDDEDIVRFKTIPIGSYYIGTNDRDVVRIYSRDFQMTIRQIVDKFGLENASEMVKTNWTNDNKDIWVDIVHTIEPNPSFDEKKIGSRFKKYRSVYYEKDGANTSPLFLRDSGFDDFPLMVPRWTTDGDDIWGSGPGWDALGDTMELQTLTKQKAKANELKIRPPMVMDPSLKGRKKSMVPGGTTYVKFDGRNTGAKPLFDVNWDTNGTEKDINIIQNRISRAFYEDLFLMLAQSDRRSITATEVAERQEEKLLALGPVLETLNDELLDPIIDRTFNIMLKRGMIAEPPAELSGVDLKVEYISIMAQAQKQVGLFGLEKLVNFAGAVAAVSPEVLDVVEFDETVRKYAEMLGTDPETIRSQIKVDQIRQARQQAIAAQQEAEQQNMEAQTLKTLSETDTSGSNAVTDLVAAVNDGAL